MVGFNGRRFDVGQSAGIEDGEVIFRVLDLKLASIICTCFERSTADIIAASLNELSLNRPAVLFVLGNGGQS